MAGNGFMIGLSYHIYADLLIVNLKILDLWYMMLTMPNKNAFVVNTWVDHGLVVIMLVYLGSE